MTRRSPFAALLVQMEKQKEANAHKEAAFKLRFELDDLTS